MRRLILGTIITGTAIFSLAGLFSTSCSSTPPVGVGGSNGGGGSTGTVTVKLDGGPVGQGGSGSAGSTGAPPTGDANCGSQTNSTTKQPPDVLLVLDRSASMYYTISKDCFCTADDATKSGTTNGTLCTNITDCSSRWAAVQPAVASTLDSSKDVNWGLKFFPTPNASQCSVSSTMEVPIGPNSADAVKTQIQNATTSLSTPTAAALKAATAYLKTLTDSNPKFILLATDGEPNCGGNPANINTVDLTGASSAAAAAYAAGFPVYVIGIGPNLSNLTQLAKSGGTTDYYPVSSPQQLVDAFAAISKEVASCTFTLSTTPPDPNNVAVYLDKNLVNQDASNGWSFGGGSKSIVLNGSTCDKVTSGTASVVQVLFGCPGVDPPKIIP